MYDIKHLIYKYNIMNKLYSHYEHYTYNYVILYINIINYIYFFYFFPICNSLDALLVVLNGTFQDGGWARR